MVFKYIFNKAKTSCEMLLKSLKLFWVMLISYVLNADYPPHHTVPIVEKKEEETQLKEAAPTWYQRVAKRFGTVVNPNTELRTSVLQKLEENKKKYKARYCPSAWNARGSYGYLCVCPCSLFRTKGTCLCGLFVSNKAYSYPGMKYQFEKGSGRVLGLVPLDAPSGVEVVKELTIEVPTLPVTPPAILQSTVSITAKTRPIPGIYDCLDFHKPLDLNGRMEMCFA